MGGESSCPSPLTQAHYFTDEKTETRREHGSAIQTPPGGGESHPADVAQEENTIRPHGGTFLKDETETPKKAPNPKAAQYLCLLWMTALSPEQI